MLALTSLFVFFRCERLALLVNLPEDELEHQTHDSDTCHHAKTDRVATNVMRSIAVRINLTCYGATDIAKV